MVTEAKAWVRRKSGPGEIVRIVSEIQHGLPCYELYAAYDEDHFGRILFDADGYWIYDGTELSVAEQEQLARFIVKWNS
jgi:hypothetical protein